MLHHIDAEVQYEFDKGIKNGKEVDPAAGG